MNVTYFVWCYSVFVVSYYGEVFKLHIWFYQLFCCIYCICVVVCAMVVIVIINNLLLTSVIVCLQCDSMKSVFWMLRLLSKL